MAKRAYQVRNWKEYNKSLVQRGSLTFWFSEEVVSSWAAGPLTGAHGNQRYTDMVIVCGLTLRQLFRLPLRATEGMLGSLAKLIGLDVRVPDHTTLCRRGQQLTIKLGIKRADKARHVLVDSTGVQVVGEGEWKTMQHGESRHQVWRKLHIAMDADEQLILSAQVTESVRVDGNYLPGLIDEIAGPIEQITGDGAYDKRNCYEAAYERGAKPVFPPQHNAIVQRNKHKKVPGLLARDETIDYIKSGMDIPGRRRQWKEENNYHRRSLVETMMSRMKCIFGDQMNARSIENQQTDLMIRCLAMNKMTELGLPDSVAIR